MDSYVQLSKKYLGMNLTRKRRPSTLKPVKHQSQLRRWNGLPCPRIRRVSIMEWLLLQKQSMHALQFSSKSIVHCNLYMHYDSYQNSNAKCHRIGKTITKETGWPNWSWGKGMTNVRHITKLVFDFKFRCRDPVTNQACWEHKVSPGSMGQNNAFRNKFTQLQTCDFFLFCFVFTKTHWRKCSFFNTWFQESHKVTGRWL